jgi:hypothetical protein
MARARLLAPVSGIKWLQMLKELHGKVLGVSLTLNRNGLGFLGLD